MPPSQSRRSTRKTRKAPTPRRRRTAEEAKRAILDAAEARFAGQGPAGIRLQQIAADVGVSHPAILHHFGSREDLMRAVMERALDALRRDLLAAMATTDPSPVEVAAQIERVFETLGTRGQARLMAWLALAGGDARSAGDDPNAFFIREIAEQMHARRRVRYVEAGRPEPPYEDSLFAILLSTLALIGDALLGEPARASGGLDDPAAGRRFRTWLAELLVAHLDGRPGADVASAPPRPTPRR